MMTSRRCCWWISLWYDCIHAPVLHFKAAFREIRMTKLWYLYHWPLHGRTARCILTSILSHSRLPRILQQTQRLLYQRLRLRSLVVPCARRPLTCFRPKCFSVARPSASSDTTFTR